MWGWMGARDQGPFETARQRAAQAVEMELSGVASYSSLSTAMTTEAARRALTDRTASGLAEALARSGARVKASATPVAVERTREGWRVKGVAQAKWEGKGAVPAEPWRGEWDAVLVEDERGELRVSRLTLTSNYGPPGG